MLSDINVEFPSLLGQLDKKLAESLSDVNTASRRNCHKVLTIQDFFAFSESCTPVQIGAREGSMGSDFTVNRDFTNETTDMLNLEDFDLSQESPDSWDLNLYGLSPFPFGRL
jgi:hypothetical protein